MSRKKARETAFKLIFEYAYLKKFNPLTLEDFLEKEKITEADKEYVGESYKGIIGNYADIIETIKSNLKNYTIERIYKTDLAILILAVYEINYAKSVATNIVINEAVELSKKYSTDKSYTFVNGVLASIVSGEKSE
jgi:N utilization substance protein B